MCIAVGVMPLVVHPTHAAHCRRRCLLLGDLYNDGLRGGHQGRHAATEQNMLTPKHGKQSSPRHHLTSVMGTVKNSGHELPA